MKSRAIVAAWEARSQKYKTAMEGVLPKSFPKPVNLYLDGWMFGEVSGPLRQGKEDAKILDIGCGYGRLSGKILRKHKKTRLWGIDVSKTYVAIFNKTLFPRGKAQVASATKLPFDNSFFDHIFMVTTLMYVLSKKEVEKVFSEVFRVLKAGGSFVLIERSPVGYGFVTLWGVVSFLRGKRHQEIVARSFSPEEITRLARKNGVRIKKAHGIPVTTLLLHVLILLGKRNSFLIGKLLSLTSWLDDKLKKILIPSLYVSYTLKK